ncbi:hypothetical protein AYM40_25190 [Paraburkholderia phytofirmans OLGA172]|uniref:Uncharacterized protein n=2 Tax=Paraburkholderia phytofirmans TaxID=261302 RepID=A0A160FRK0_9BURK|nr:hypothetical protein AYM40_25190 [Paraburkholderia phytofirmans OLGA172]
MAMFVLTSAMSLPAEAQTFSSVADTTSKAFGFSTAIGGARPRRSGDANPQLSLEETQLLGSPSAFDNDYLQLRGAPTDAPAIPSESFRQEPQTPTEALLAVEPELAAPSADSGGFALKLTQQSRAGKASSAGDTEAQFDIELGQGIWVAPEQPPFGGDPVYRKPW